MALNLKHDPTTDKFFWIDGYWTDPRWRDIHGLPNDESKKLADQIRCDWADLNWVEQTEWFKEKMATNEIDLRHLKASRKSRK